MALAYAECQDALMDEKGLLMALHAGTGLDAIVVADLFDAISTFGTSRRDTSTTAALAKAAAGV